MKHQLIGLLKKVNDGASNAPTMVNNLIHQYQMMSIALTLAFFVLTLTAIIVLVISIKACNKSKAEENENSILYDSMTEEPSLIAVLLWCGLATLIIVGIIGTFYHLVGAVAPDWSIINSLINNSSF